MILTALAVLVSGFAIFVAPGAVLLAAAGVLLRPAERLAFAFAASLVLLTACFAIDWVLGLSIAAGPLTLALATGVAALGLRRGLGKPTSEDPSSWPVPVSATGSFATGVLIILTIAFAVAAVEFAPIGSIDRWWYLAYAKSYLNPAGLSLSEPFLGSGQVFARFGLHPWLFGLALWSWVCSLEPIHLYERAAPILVVVASVCTSIALAQQLFSDRTRRALCVLATMLLWNGALIPVLARAGEDKVLAAAALVPLCFVAFLRLLHRDVDGGRRASGRDYLLLLIAGIATASVHALAYAFALVAMLAAVVLLAVLGSPNRRTLAGIVAALLLIATAPAATGLVVHQRLSEIGANQDTPDHPVVRVHEGRERLIAIPNFGYIVSPDLLLHPFLFLALVGLPFLRVRRITSEPSDHPDSLAAVRPPLSEPARMFLVATTLAPLAIAFVPPLPILAGQILPPWMVYRVLWLVPVAPLAALGLGAIGSRFSRREMAATCLLLALGLPVVADGVRTRLKYSRERLAVPSNAEFVELIRAVTELPTDALIVAAPELSERLPGLTGRNVVAALDRSTIVFSGSRERGEARLRARSAFLAGDPQAQRLTLAAKISPTHAVYAPAAEQHPQCRKELLRTDRYALCELRSDIAPSVVRQLRLADDALPERILARAECSEPAPNSGRDPWTADAATAECNLSIPDDNLSSTDLYLLVEVSTGRAADEIVVLVIDGETGQSVGRSVARGTGARTVALELPGNPSASLRVIVTSSFLPSLRLGEVSLATR